MFSKSTYKDGPIITHIRWLPDSSGVGFLTKTATGHNQLFLGDLKTKTVVALTPEKEHVIYFDIRDRNHFVYSVESPKIQENSIHDTHATAVVGTGRSLESLIFPADLYPLMSKSYDLSELWAVMKGKPFRITSELSGRPIFLRSDAERILALSPDGRSVLTVVAVTTVPSKWESLYAPPLPSDSDRIRAGPQDLETLSSGRGYVSEYAIIELSSGKVWPVTNAPTGTSAGWWSLQGGEWSSDGKSVVLLNTFLESKEQNSDSLPSRPCVAVVGMANGRASCLERLKGKAKTKSGFEDSYRNIVRVRFAGGSSRQVKVDFSQVDDANQLISTWSRGSANYKRSDNGVWELATTANGWMYQDRASEISVKQSFIDPP